MIAILGSRNDDLLYLSEYADCLGKEEYLPCGGGYRRGKIDGVEVVLCLTGESSFLSAIYLSELLSLYPIPLVIKVGDGVGLDPSFELGDIVMGEIVYPHGINYHADGYRYGEIPGGIPASIGLSKDYASMLQESGFAFKQGSIMSGEKAIYEKGEFDAIVKRRYLYLNSSFGLYDPSAYGVALSGYLHQCAVVMLETVSFRLGDEEGKLTMRKVALQKQVELGRMVCRILEGATV